MKRGEIRKEKKERKAKVRNKTRKVKRGEEERKRRCRRLFSQILVRESLPSL